MSLRILVQHDLNHLCSNVRRFGAVKSIYRPWRISALTVLKQRFCCCSFCERSLGCSLQGCFMFRVSCVFVLLICLVGHVWRYSRIALGYCRTLPSCVASFPVV